METYKKTYKNNNDKWHLSTGLQRKIRCETEVQKNNPCQYDISNCL